MLTRTAGGGRLLSDGVAAASEAGMLDRSEESAYPSLRLAVTVCVGSRAGVDENEGEIT